MTGTMSQVERVGGLIPHFFFDAIGRIVPGGFLIISFFVENGKRPIFDLLKDYLDKYSIAGPAVALVLFLIVSFTVGFLLGSISYWVVEVPWNFFVPWTLKGVRKRYDGDPDKETRLEKLLISQFGFSFPTGEQEQQGEKIRQLSWLCAYFVWGANTDLGVMTSRWDAEALAARSLLLASMCLAVYQFLNCHWFSFWFFVCCVIGAFSAYGFHREKQVFGRFDLFQACHKPTS
jgi:hypothetical protein